MKITSITTFLAIFGAGALFAQDNLELGAETEKDELDTATEIGEVETVKNPELDNQAERGGTYTTDKVIPKIQRNTPDPTQGELSKIPPDEKQVLSTHMERASVFVRGIRLQEALDEIYKAEAIAKKFEANFYQLHNLKGAIFTKMRDFGQARSAFDKAIALDPESFHPQFNLAELNFVEQKWVDAEKSFTRLVERYGNKKLGQPLEIEETTERLMQFKILICMLMQGREDDANELMSQFNYLEDNPAYYYGNAAVEFAKENKEEAQGWLDSAKRIYAANLLEVFIDSFVEVGWVETL